MEIIVSGRHVDVDLVLKEYVEKKLGKLEQEYPKLTMARLVLEVERSWYIAEGHASGKNVTLDAKARTRDPRTAIDQVADKLERQLRKYLERIQSHHVDKERLVQDDNLNPEPA